VRLAASHSASAALIATLLTDLTARQQLAVELVNADSQVVRALVADGRADVGVAASRPNHAPNPACARPSWWTTRPPTDTQSWMATACRSHERTPMNA
jgi:DNA-binding transcriptional LysR family regulator